MSSPSATGRRVLLYLGEPAAYVTSRGSGSSRATRSPRRPRRIRPPASAEPPSSPPPSRPAPWRGSKQVEVRSGRSRPGWRTPRRPPPAPPRRHPPAQVLRRAPVDRARRSSSRRAPARRSRPPRAGRPSGRRVARRGSRRRARRRRRRGRARRGLDVTVLQRLAAPRRRALGERPPAPTQHEDAADEQSARTPRYPPSSLPRRSRSSVSFSSSRGWIKSSRMRPGRSAWPRSTASAVFRPRPPRARTS